jgi:transcriptional regulator with XRE-family HTH domain
MLKTLGITQSQFADDIGIKQGSVSDIIRGKTAGLSETAIKLCSFIYNINPDWLLTGEGEMFLPEDQAKKPVEKKHANGLTEIQGNAEIFHGEINHVEWFNRLSLAQQTAILAIAEIDDPEYIEEVKGSTLFKVRQQRDAEKLMEEERSLRKKGEAG